MIPWSFLHGQFLNMLARNPQFQTILKRSIERASRTPIFQRLKREGETAYRRILNIARDGPNKRQSHRGSHFFHLNFLRQKLLLFWQHHRIKLVAFLTANFMGIIFLFQVFSLIYSNLRMRINYSNSPLQTLQKPSSHDNMKKYNGDHLLESEDCDRKPSQRTNDHSKGVTSYQRQHNGETITDPFTNEMSASNDALPFSSTLFDDALATNAETVEDKCLHFYPQNTASNFSTTEKKNDVDYQTSFLVKMDDITEFTSSLERENLTGAITTSGTGNI